MESERIVKNNEIEIEEVNVYTDDCGTTRKACVTDCMIYVLIWNLFMEDYIAGNVSM